VKASVIRERDGLAFTIPNPYTRPKQSGISTLTPRLLALSPRDCQTDTPKHLIYLPDSKLIPIT